MKMKITISRLLSFTVICMAIFFSIIETGYCQAETQEWKLLIKPEVFADGRDTGYAMLAERVSTTAENLGMTAELAAEKEKCRYIRYFDTINRDLAKEHYILRQRSKVKHGIEQLTGDLTLKLRLPFFSQTQADAFLAAESNELITNKIEADTVGFVDNKFGRNQTMVSFSSTYKDIAVMNALSAEAVQAYFPILVKNSVNLSDKLSVINQTLEYSTALGTVAANNDDTTLLIDIAVWYEPLSNNAEIAEISWKADAENIAASKFFEAFQENCQDILRAGQNKTAYITNYSN